MATRTAQPDRAGNGTPLAPWRDIEVGVALKVCGKEREES